MPGLYFAPKILDAEGATLTAAILEKGLEQVLVKTQRGGGLMLELLYALQQAVLVKPAVCVLSVGSCLCSARGVQFCLPAQGQSPWPTGTFPGGEPSELELHPPAE